MYKLLNIKTITPSQDDELVNLFNKKIGNYVPSITFLTRYQRKKFEERCVEKEIHGKYVINVDYKDYNSFYKDPFIIFLKKKQAKDNIRALKQRKKITLQFSGYHFKKICREVPLKEPISVNIENPATVSKFLISLHFAQIKPLVSYFRKYK